jgi:predicted AAA+ superfamily ATPase
MYIDRRLAPILRKSKKSILLLGPRQTGKSTLMQSLGHSLAINLADEKTYLDFTRNPSEIRERMAGKEHKTVFIDEIQRLPSLLNTLQEMIDSGRFSTRFYLTGSSAAKLKRGKANLLPGRIHAYQLGPLSCGELSYDMDVKQAMETGTLPAIYLEISKEERTKTLRSYGATYLKEEIQSEALTRNIEGFSRFLFVAAQCAGHFLDLSKLASEAQISRQSAIRYFEILEETLIVNRCHSFSNMERKRLIHHPKFYFFDTGVLNALRGGFEATDDRKGALFEHLFFNQLIAGAASLDREMRVSTYRTEHGAEVDFIVEWERETWAVELKASTHVGENNLRGLRNFSRFYRKAHRSVLAYFGNTEKTIEGIEIAPWQVLLKKMGL